MPEQETPKKPTVTISLPRSYLTSFNELRLWQEFSSFSDMVRDSVRKEIQHYELRKTVRERHEPTK